MLPILNSFGMRENYGDRPYPSLADGDVGMVEDTRLYDKGSRPPLYAPNGHYTGTPEQWLDGSIVGVHPPLDITRLGYSRECLRGLGFVEVEPSIRSASRIAVLPVPRVALRSASRVGVLPRVGLVVRSASRVGVLPVVDLAVRSASRVGVLPVVDLAVRSASTVSALPVSTFAVAMRSASRVVVLPVVGLVVRSASRVTAPVGPLMEVRSASRVNVEAMFRVNVAVRSAISVRVAPSVNLSVRSASRLSVGLGILLAVRSASRVNVELAMFMELAVRSASRVSYTGNIPIDVAVRSASRIEAGTEFTIRPGADCESAGMTTYGGSVSATVSDADQWWTFLPPFGVTTFTLEQIAGSDGVNASIYAGTCDDATFLSTIDYATSPVTLPFDGVTNAFIIMNALPSGSGQYRLHN